MNCPKCGLEATKTLNTRPQIAGRYRRRECYGCGFKFSTMERVIKKDTAEKKTNQIELHLKKIINILNSEK